MRSHWGQTGAFISAFRFLADRETWNIDKQFLLGPAFLVSPVLEPVSMEALGCMTGVSGGLERGILSDGCLFYLHLLVVLS